MPQHRGLYFQQWYICGRCGFIYPIGQLTLQKGLLVCPKDYDNLDVEYRHEHADAHRGEPDPGFDPGGALWCLDESHERGLPSAAHITRRGARTRSSTDPSAIRTRARSGARPIRPAPATRT